MYMSSPDHINHLLDVMEKSMASCPQKSHKAVRINIVAVD